MDSVTSPSPPVAPLLPPLNSLALASPSSPPSSSLNAGPSSESTAPTIPPTVAEEDTERIEGKEEITYRAYQGEEDLDAIVNLVDDELSEPYNLYTYRYFLDEWPHLCFFAFAGPLPIGVIVCKQEPHTKSSRSIPLPGGEVVIDAEGRELRTRPLNRGYLAMLSTKKEWRGRGIATHLLRLSLSVMHSPPPSLLASLPPDHPSQDPVDEIVLETEADNAAALAFYAKMGFVREKRLYRFYLNGKDAYRLRLDLTVAKGS